LSVGHFPDLLPADGYFSFPYANAGIASDEQEPSRRLSRLNRRQQVEDAPPHGVSPCPFEAKKDYAVVGFGHVSTDVTETLIQGEKASPGLARRVGYERIGAALQSFVCDGIHEVAQTAKIVSQFYGQVLVEFYAHSSTAVSVPLREPTRPHRQWRRGCARP
jgi:hypothetical protein